MDSLVVSSVGLGEIEIEEWMQKRGHGRNATKQCIVRASVAAGPGFFSQSVTGPDIRHICDSLFNGLNFFYTKDGLNLEAGSLCPIKVDVMELVT